MVLKELCIVSLRRSFAQNVLIVHQGDWKVRHAKQIKSTHDKWQEISKKVIFAAY